MLCCIFNYPPHYRKHIYLELANKFNSHFYFGGRVRNEKIQKLELSELPGFKKEFHVYFFRFLLNWEWTPGMIALAFNKNYKQYLITPNLFAINQWLFVLFCWSLRKEVYTWEHGLKTKKIRLIWLMQHKLFYFFIRGIFLYGNRAKVNMEQLGFREKKLHVIYNSLNYKESLKLRGELKSEPLFENYFKNNDPVLVFIGRLTKVKKLELLISAHQILMKKGFKCNVVLIGDGEAFTELLSQVREYNQVDRYCFIGPIYDEIQVSKLLFSSDICISPGNVGLTAIHAFSYGLPVITNDNYDVQMPEHEIIEEAVTGMFFKENSSESLASKIEWWLENKKDREEIRRLCYQKIDNFYNPISQVKIFNSVIYGKAILK